MKYYNIINLKEFKSLNGRIKDIWNILKNYLNK